MPRDDIGGTPIVLDHVLRYLARGWAVTRVPYRGKIPDGGKGWHLKAIRDAETAKARFNGDGRHNAGVMLERRLSDADLDSPEALTIAGYFLPGTPCAFGRASTRMSHRIYRSDAAGIVGKATLQFEDPEPPKGVGGKPGKAMLLELRVGGGGKAAQTVFPGSVHESGETIEFEGGFDGEPAEVDGKELIQACREIAAACLVARGWPAEGGHRPAQEIGGFLARCGWGTPRVGLFMEAVMAHAGGPNAKKHVQTARDAAEAYAKGTNAFGFPALKDRFGEKRAKKIAEWLGYDARTETKAPHHDYVSAESAPHDAPAGGGQIPVTLSDFYAYLPEKAKYLFVPTGDLWPEESVDTVLGSVVQKSEYKGRGKRTIKASTWLARNRAVLQMTWAPGRPEIIENVLVAEGGFIPRPGARIVNLYRPPIIELGDPAQAGRWLDHLKRLYPDEAGHLLRWFAHGVQRPHEKVNHGGVLGGGQGIGKDTLLEALAQAVGPWSVQEISPAQIMDSFNPFAKSVMLRVSEAHDTGDENKFKIYERSKTLLAAPPATIPINEKHKKPYRVPNVVGVIYTTNHVEDALYLPDDDRRHFLAGTEVVKEDFPENYWVEFWDWYTKQGGLGHVAALLHSIDLSTFDPKAPPLQTAAHRRAVSLGRPESDGRLIDIIDALAESVPDGLILPAAFTRDMLAAKCDDAARAWLDDPKSRKAISHGLARCGYVAVANPDAKSGFWSVHGRRQPIYASVKVSPTDRKAAAEHLTNRGTLHTLREWARARGCERLLQTGGSR